MKPEQIKKHYEKIKLKLSKHGVAASVEGELTVRNGLDKSHFFRATAFCCRQNENDL